MEKKYLYEMLVTGDADGIKGAQVIYASTHVNPETGESRTQVGEAQSLGLGHELNAVLGELAAQALKENVVLKREVSQLQQERGVLEDFAQQQGLRLESQRLEIARLKENDKEVNAASGADPELASSDSSSDDGGD
ncbi:hypothetical protein [Bordetella trematum]|uniref:hypothetical protein n=1 Tax=Bordetella trematum TaxID=123899 RepID=UPI000D8E83EB|nr:hypothetical protein [Bordetella trematum]SPU51295.1 Uncharacterised protein [Bordetella trematum]VDH05636.1 Uncharacterised protein [Bordetella trematum]